MNLSTNIQQAANLLREGGLVAFPTETVFGLGADALNAEAVARIFAVKRRPRFDPLIVHVGGRSQAEGMVAEFPDLARKLADAFWPGPLTLVLAKRPHIPGIVTAGLPTVAVRVPDHPVALELIKSAGTPIAAPSANLFGRVSPTRVEHVAEQLGEHLDMVLEAPPCRVGVESTILAFDHGAPCLLRPGGLPLEAIESVAGPVRRRPEKEEEPPESPGRLKRHYCPGTPLRRISPGEMPPPAGARLGLLSFCGTTPATGFATVEILSSRGDLGEAAARLFEALHRLDTLGLDRILAERFPDRGLGTAINDRLARASENAPPGGIPTCPDISVPSKAT